MKAISRIVYGLVGLTGLVTAGWVILDFNNFKLMPILTISVIVLATIGAINWGITAIMNDRNKDLFGLLGL